MTLFRQALLEHLVARHAISEELKVRLLGWRHPGLCFHECTLSYTAWPL
jgi:hypothetical protein